MLRKGFAGGYHYRRVKVAGDERYHDEPNKNAFSHVHDALQYALSGGGEVRALTGPRAASNVRPIVAQHRLQRVGRAAHERRPAATVAGPPAEERAHARGLGDHPEPARVLHPPP